MGQPWNTQEDIALIEVVKSVRDRRAASGVATVDPNDLPQAGGFWAPMESVCEAVRITKGFPNRKASALSSHWCKLKKEILTVTTLPEDVCVNVAGDVWTTLQSITLMELFKFVKHRRDTQRIMSQLSIHYPMVTVASGRLWKAPGRMCKWRRDSQIERLMP